MKIFRQLRALFRRDKLDADMAEEMRLHLERRTAENVAAGMSPSEARFAALRKFGGVEQAKEVARDQRPWVWLEQLGRDLRLAARMLAKAPGFTIVAAGTLALGIGACTAVYSVVDGLLLRPIGHDAHTEREVQLCEAHLPAEPLGRVSAANFLDWQKRATSFSAMRAGTGGRVLLTGQGEPRWLSAGRSTHQLLEPHAWTLALGRGFLPEEDAPGRDKVVIISYALWQQIFGGDARALGSRLEIDGVPREVVGVISEEVGRFLPVDAWLPLALTDDQRGQRRSRTLSVWARLKPEVTIERARAELDTIAAQLAQQFPDANGSWGVAIVPVVEQQGGGGLRGALWTLLAAVGCVLLIACANVASLLLARGSVRQREIAVRAALGAGRGRIVRQLLTESLLLALLGGAGGVLLAHGGLRLLHAYATARIPRLAYVELNGAVLAAALVITLVTGVVFGLAPAWLAARTELNAALKTAARGSTEGSRGRLRRALVVVEVALAIVLLAGSGALIRRLVERAGQDPGFVADNVTVMQVNLVRARYAAPVRRAAFVDAVLARIAALAGVDSAGVTTALPTVQSGLRFQVEGRPERARDEWPITCVYGVTADFFPAMGIRLRQGRIFSTSDDSRAGRTVVINERLAREQFPNENPIGRRIAFASGRAVEWCEIVGVVNDVTQYGNGTDTVMAAQCYVPFAQQPSEVFSIIVRSRGEIGGLAAALKGQVYAVDKDQPVSFVRPLREVVDERLDGVRFATHLLAVFSAVALAIAAVGIYGVIACMVSQRKTEIGIRLALGAQRADIVRLIAAFAAFTVGWGVLAGVATSVAAGHTIEAMLYGVDARDPLTLVGIALLLAAVVALACVVPVWRAAKTDPMRALRAE
jgi:putative ABC transport system permease protein